MRRRIPPRPDLPRPARPGRTRQLPFRLGAAALSIVVAIAGIVVMVVAIGAHSARYEGDGIAFSYPGSWRAPDHIPEDGLGLPPIFDLRLSPSDLNTIMVRARDMGTPITDANFSTAMNGLHVAYTAKVGGWRGTVTGPLARERVAGLPGLLGTWTRTGTGGERLQIRTHDFFAGQIGYEIECQANGASADELLAGCEQIRTSIELTLRSHPVPPPIDPTLNAVATGHGMTFGYPPGWDRWVGTTGGSTRVFAGFDASNYVSIAQEPSVLALDPDNRDPLRLDFALSIQHGAGSKDRILTPVTDEDTGDLWGFRASYAAVGLYGEPITVTVHRFFAKGREYDITCLSTNLGREALEDGCQRIRDSMAITGPWT